MTDHTPGKWKRHHIHGKPFPHHTHITSDLGYDEIGIMHFRTIAFISGNAGPEESDANANLIAAAPDMKAALEEARDWVQEYITQMRSYTVADDAQKALDNIYDALRKAEGFTCEAQG